MNRTMDRNRREAIEKYGDAPTTPTETLAHVLGVYAAEPDNCLLLTATSGVYGDGVRTGLTVGDLRALQAALGGKPAHRGPGRPASELPDWAVGRLSERGIDTGEATHFIASRDGRTITAAVDGKPVRLTR
jgi:hypothetical protein